MGYNLLINGIYWGYNPFTNHLLTSWEIRVPYMDAHGQKTRPDRPDEDVDVISALSDWTLYGCC